MTQEAFIEVLNREKYSYKMEGDRIVVTYKGYVDLDALTSLPPGVVFRNGGFISLSSLTGDYFNRWEGNIEGVNSKRLLNLMISKGIFER